MREYQTLKDNHVLKIIGQRAQIKRVTSAHYVVLNTSCGNDTWGMIDYMRSRGYVFIPIGEEQFNGTKAGK